MRQRRGLALTDPPRAPVPGRGGAAAMLSPLGRTRPRVRGQRPPRVTSPPRVDTVPVIGGTGALGFAIGLRLARAGVPIAIGSRDASRAGKAARRMGERLPRRSSGSNSRRRPRTRTSRAALRAFRAQSETLTNLKQALRPGQILVDGTVPLAAAVAGKATRLLGVPQGSRPNRRRRWSRRE